MVFLCWLPGRPRAQRAILPGVSHALSLSGGEPESRGAGYFWEESPHSHSTIKGSCPFSVGQGILGFVWGVCVLVFGTQKNFAQNMERVRNFWNSCTIICYAGIQENFRHGKTVQQSPLSKSREHLEFKWLWSPVPLAFLAFGVLQATCPSPCSFPYPTCIWHTFKSTVQLNTQRAVHQSRGC